MPLPNCSPPYVYRPTFTAGPTICSAPIYNEHRSRLFAGGTFFRSRLIIGTEVMSDACNDISIECVFDMLNLEMIVTIRYQAVIVKTYVIPQEDDTMNPGECSPNAINGLRTEMNTNDPNDYVWMPPRMYDTAYDDSGIDGDCLLEFPETYMSGGEGGPQDDSTITSIRTGPERTIIIIATTEDEYGEPAAVPADRKVQQYDGTNWVTYTPNADCV